MPRKHEHKYEAVREIGRFIKLKCVICRKQKFIYKEKDD